VFLILIFIEYNNKIQKTFILILNVKSNDNYAFFLTFKILLFIFLIIKLFFKFKLLPTLFINACVLSFYLELNILQDCILKFFNLISFFNNY